jgi:hypothetical protein
VERKRTQQRKMSLIGKKNTLMVRAKKSTAACLALKWKTSISVKLLD